MEQVSDSRPQYLDALLQQHLRTFLGELEPGAMALLLEHLQWVELAGGETLMRQGEPGDAMYITVSGRLRTYIADEDGRQRMVREVTRGQVVGEMSLYTDEPRSATLVAIRDSVLVRLSKAEFKRLLAISAQVSIALTRQIIRRLQTESGPTTNDRPVTIGLLPITEGVELAALAEALATQLRKQGRVAVLDRARLDAQLGEPGITERPRTDADANRRIAMQLDAIEAAHDFVLLLGDTTPTPWTSRCSRHCDELLLLANADQSVRLHAIEKECLVRHAPYGQASEASQMLVLLHPAQLHMPAGTKAWLKHRPLAEPVHIRPALERDLARLARLISRTAVGLVFAGGGARGLAHMGVYRALQERGIEIDVVGGTSIGSVMATLVALDQPIATLTATVRKAFARSPTGDFNLIPMLSLIKGRRLRRIVSQALAELGGAGTQIEDLWKGYYCVATNYSQASEQVLKRGPLLDAMLASIAIPGALPPLIHEGDLLCDGGTFNNFPVDVMRGLRGVGKVIGVDLSFKRLRRMDHADMPGTWALLRDRLRPRAKRRYRLPSLATYLMNVTILYSTSRQRQARKLTDIYMNPPLDRVGMLQWKRFDEIEQQGYEHACLVLDGSLQVAQESVLQPWV
ncbi:cyclic nucleotide-binding and patatin-like phospholipase domain-containing protein [Roseateles toxinivorans]|uniref:NTE family protein n=1 Tax=Roseateles toxinivorans TaxID=270368 RepID=A0A4R6QR35_9BURK|nr:cyclic nucleotide-binding and patatin-like phospholipase domain-containing protein [Roseateles toxinivorans]TDP73032.1 NTE family protein [Roseateles toxinivorans]